MHVCVPACTYVLEYYSAIKKKTLREISESQEDRHHMYHMVSSHVRAKEAGIIE